MKTERLLKGQRRALPLYIWKESGWAINDCPCDGLLIVNESLEKGRDGIFLSDEKLKELGYSPLGGQKILEKILVLTKKQLISIADKLGVSNSGGKKQISVEILTSLGIEV